MKYIKRIKDFCLYPIEIKAKEPVTAASLADLLEAYKSVKFPMVRWKKKRFLWKQKYSASRIAIRQWEKALKTGIMTAEGVSFTRKTTENIDPALNNAK